jgi:hypothetical protein
VPSCEAIRTEHFGGEAAAAVSEAFVARAQGCGLEELQTVIDAASSLQTLMQDAHGDLIR